MKHFLFLIFLFGKVVAQNPYVHVLGVAQDGGYPQANCKKKCCKAIFEGKATRQFVSCIAVVDPISKQQWIFDATPDFTQQLYLLNNPAPKSLGIFLTHAHIGHYSGLMYLGREAMGANQVKVYVMPKMKNFIEQNGPWSQLVALQNIDLQPIKEDSVIVLNERISVQAFKVPHRDEFSETVGYKIFTSNKSLIFIPDIDKWQKWNRSLEEMIKSVDYAFLDGTFYKDGEIIRPMSEVPHPFVTETMDLLKNLSATERAKVHFIHFNHTNPVMKVKSLESIELRQKGFKVAFQGEKVKL